MGADGILPSQQKTAAQALGVSDPRAAQEALQAPAFDPVTLLAGGIGGGAYEGMAELPNMFKSLGVQTLLANALSPSTPERNNYAALAPGIFGIDYEEIAKDVPTIARDMGLTPAQLQNMMDSFAKGMKVKTIYDHLISPNQKK